MVEGCGAAVMAAGYCSSHYARWRRYGDFYNRERRHSTLGQRSPADYEKITLALTPEEQAA